MVIDKTSIIKNYETQNVTLSYNPTDQNTQQNKDDTISIEELLDMMEAASSTNHVGRVVVFTLLGLKRKYAQQRFQISDVLNTIGILPKILHSSKTGLDVVAELLKGNFDILTNEKRCLLLNETAFEKVKNISQRSDFSTVIDKNKMDSEKVEIAELLEKILCIKDRDKRKELTKTIVVGALQGYKQDNNIIEGKGIDKEHLLVKKPTNGKQVRRLLSLTMTVNIIVVIKSQAQS